MKRLVLSLLAASLAAVVSAQSAPTGAAPAGPIRQPGEEGQ